MITGDVRVHTDSGALSAAVAQRIVEIAQDAIASRGKFHIALSGGSTPRQLYECLRQAKYAERIKWDRVYVYFGDERMVPPDHADSNYRMARESLLDHVPIAATQIHRIEGNAPSPGEAAKKYASTLSALVPMSAQGVVQFDLILLGLGTDGHVASIFPGTSILHERVRLVEAVFVERLDSWRVSITLPVIDYGRNVLILVSGDGKAEIVKKVFTTRQSPPYPVQLINPQGTFEWHLDKAAAALLPPELLS